MLHTEEHPSPTGAQIFEFYESELFQETLQNSEVPSSSNCCHDEPYNSSHRTIVDHFSSTTQDMSKYDGNTNNDLKPGTSALMPTITATRRSNLSLLLEDQIDDISASIDFTPSPSFSDPQNHYFDKAQEAFSMASIDNQISFESMEDGLNYTSSQQQVMVAATMPGEAVPPPFSATGFEDECLPCLPSHIHSRNCLPAMNNCCLIDPLIGPYLPSSGCSAISAPFPDDNSGIFTGSGLVYGPELSLHHEPEFLGDNGGLYLADSRVFNCSTGNLQALSSESQHDLLNRRSSTALASEISSLEDPTLVKVAKLSAEERKNKIQRYLRKRNQRNFTKKIKYACRKTLADSRPRVRGRFAKSDQVLGDFATTNHEQHLNLFSNSIPPHKQRPRKVLKEEGLDHSAIFAQINGVNCSYPIQSWI